MPCFSAVLAVGFLVAVVPAPSRVPAPVPPNNNASLPPVKWELDALNREPFRLIKATPEARGTQVRFLIEFTRPPTLSEQYDWERHNGAVVFRFLDEDGLVLRSVQPSWQGEFVPKKGARMALVMPMPDERTLMRTRTVVAE
jgi:hypothetical protein